MGLITTEPRSSPHPLSLRLVHELGDPHSTLRATTDGSGAALLIHAGGEIDGRNEHLWRQLVTEAAAGVTAPGPLIVDVTGLDFMGCCAFAALADEAQRCRCRGIDPASGEPPADRRPDRRSGWAEPSAAHLPDRRYCARQGHGRSSPLLIPAVRAPSRPPVAPPLGPIAPPRDDVRVRRACGIACLAR